MTKKISFGLDKAVSRVTRSSVFDRLVREIECIEIPPQYIQSVKVQYADGNIAEISGSLIPHPIPMHKDAPWDKMDKMFMNMKDIKVYIDLDRLEFEVNIKVEDLLGKYC